MGKKVRYIDVDSPSLGLKNSQEYEVYSEMKFSGTVYYYLQGFGLKSAFNSNRFVDVAAPQTFQGPIPSSVAAHVASISAPVLKKVRCTDSGSSAYIRTGQVYSVIDIVNSASSIQKYKLAEFASIGYFSAVRFEDVIDDISYPIPTPRGMIASNPTKPKADLSDWRVWRDQGRRSNECPCGGTYGQCDYHPRAP